MENELNTSSESVRVKSSSPLRGYFAGLVMIICLVAGFALFYGVFGAADNFEGNNPNNHPKPGNYLGIIYKGGIIIPFAIAMVLLMFAISIERLITIGRASGKGSMDVFVQRISIHLENEDIQAALDECDAQRGSVGNVVREAIRKYGEMVEEAKKDKAQGITPDQSTKEHRVASIQKALEEATALELPMLERHLIIIATIVSLATLVGLIGTVIGMIKAFSALATSGAPDAVALANGIAEALINTAIGITNSAFATVFYNYFTSRIDAMVFRMDEAGYSIVQSYNEKY
ncbi:MAG: MotA/TolQ/ExbB proton channel family protein [Bacteroidia bacterium]|nr:MotA/TolQ/ExbB proton channel family protein [Bacteroidia bacterium]